MYVVDVLLMGQDLPDLSSTRACESEKAVNHNTYLEELGRRISQATFLRSRQTVVTRRVMHFLRSVLAAGSLISEFHLPSSALSVHVLHNDLNNAQIPCFDIGTAEEEAMPSYPEHQTEVEHGMQTMETQN